MNIESYLNRINYRGPVTPTLGVLSNLQYNHLLSVPFENLDIHKNLKIDLTNLYAKIVIQKRGGFCYELNGLFYQLLIEIGFTVKMVSARVYDGKKGYGPEFDHMALIVIINNDNYLVDVGFGAFSMYPIKIALDKEVHDPGGVFRIETFDETYLIVKKSVADAGFLPEYLFSERERLIGEFQEMCNYHQTSDESHFRQKIICSLPTKSGRITLTGDTLKLTNNSEVKEIKLKNEMEFQRELWNHFGIKL